MLIVEGKNVKLAICDIETLAGLFDVGVYDPDKGIWIEFEVSEYKNELYEFVDWYTKNDYDYMVTFNGIGFDQQVLEWVVKNYEGWYDLSNLEITSKIQEYSSRIIDDQNYNLPREFNEKDFHMKAIDLFKIHHFDNEARRTSLKWCAFMMNMDVEEMPIHFSRKDLSREEVEMVRSYRRNDVKVTEGLLYVTLGKSDLPELSDYKGKNKIQDRFDVMKETGLQCLNWSDVKIGEEWNKLDYMQAEGIVDEWKLITKDIKTIYGTKFKNYFPKTVSFQTQVLRDFKEMLGEEIIRPSRRKEKKQEYKIKIGKTDYTIAKGGIHSNEKHRYLHGNGGSYIVRDADVGSQYPKFIEKNEIFPPHLKRTIIDQFREKIGKRITLKSNGKRLEKEGKNSEARPYLSVQEMLKLCMNGGYYGKLNQNGSFLEYPEGMLKVTIGCQMEILMLIEMLESAGITVVSGNTDGVVSYFPAEKESLYYAVCKEWEKKVGNDKLFNGVQLGALEYADFEGFWQESINHYIGKNFLDISPDVPGEETQT